ncbi:PE family protein, partial [Mycobacterium sp. E796]|uniref:PE family protein n=1 Tax=Mycobacterium sp. E796 TaxID=1834151 RepID=UPI000A6CDED8
MSYVVAVPEFLASAASDLSRIGTAVTAANAAAAAPTTGVLAAGADEVSAAVASLFSGHANDFQGSSAQAAAFHAQFVQALSGAKGAYAAAEAASASQLQMLWQDVRGAINAPTDALFGRPLIGNGANGTTDADGVGTPGGAGGILIGRGGNGGDSIAAGV